MISMRHAFLSGTVCRLIAAVFVGSFMALNVSLRTVASVLVPKSFSAFWPRVNWSECKNSRSNLRAAKMRKVSLYGNACHDG